jgi:hypothetical protein
MPTTTDYFTNLKTQLQTASRNKKQALQNQFDMATGARFNPTTGALTYRTDAAGNPLYGTLDVDYQEQQRGINTQSEGAGMLRSGQRARSLATSDAGYRAAVGGLAASLAAGQTAVDDAEAVQLAEYEAMYGPSRPSGGGGGGSATPRPPGGSQALPPITPPPTVRTPSARTPARTPSSPTSPDAAERRATGGTPPPVPKPQEHQARRPTRPPLPRTTRR